MQENRTSARTKALLLALIAMAAAALFCGLFSGLELLPFGDDYNQAIYEQPPRSPRRSPPPPPPTDAPASVASPPGFTVNQDTVEVRAGPSTEYRVIGVVNRGQTFTPNGRTRGGDWLQFSWEGTDGWVHTQQLIVTGSGQLPVVQDFPPPLSDTSPPDSPPPDSPPPDSPGSPPPDSPSPDSSTPDSSPGGPSGPPPSG